MNRFADLNAESVEITRLALWLKTARRQHRLQNLEATIKVGNSLISDSRFTDRPFDWEQAFPSQKGKFDIVIGNPPYVRSETISAIKPYLREFYKCFDSGADFRCLTMKVARGSFHPQAFSRRHSALTCVNIFEHKRQLSAALISVMHAFWRM